MAHDGWQRRRNALGISEEQARRAQEEADRAQREADRLFILHWNEVMFVIGGPAQPSPTIGQALEHGYRYLRVRCPTCRRVNWIALDIVQRPLNTPVWTLEGALACEPCREREANEPGRRWRKAPRAVIERLTKDKTDRDSDLQQGPRAS